MKIALCSLALSTSFLLCAHADLTIVYSSSVQPAAQAAKGEDTAPASNVTIKIKGDKARIEASPKLSTIVDGTTGDVVNLMNDVPDAGNRDGHHADQECRRRRAEDRLVLASE